ncbi:MAG: hypothetical protein Q8M88_12080 [Phenylobacterium sp.]|uniref:hypothetical protein n=1 Tax=Phenylobacterium sp. TaxID=1871053 RepID=UPI00273673C5|nr:hypothetical protein [Phenylobacterium sp.]MDP3175160.1 hypothetical protein [Phenylobacterium sp.]
MDTARAPIASAPLSLGELSSDSLGVNRPQTAPTTNRKAKKNRDGSSAMGEMSRATSRSLTPLPPSSTMAAEIGPPAALTGHVSLAVSSDGLGGFGAAIAVAQARQN